MRCCSVLSTVLMSIFETREVMERLALTEDLNLVVISFKDETDKHNDDRNLAVCVETHTLREGDEQMRCTERMRPKRMFTCRKHPNSLEFSGVVKTRVRSCTPTCLYTGIQCGRCRLTIRISSTGLWRMLFSLFAARHKQHSVKYVK
jgi:hypothetical protein